MNDGYSYTYKLFFFCIFKFKVEIPEFLSCNPSCAKTLNPLSPHDRYILSRLVWYDTWLV